MLAQDTSNIGVLLDFSHCNLDLDIGYLHICIFAYLDIGKVEKIILIEQFFM